LQEPDVGNFSTVTYVVRRDGDFTISLFVATIKCIIFIFITSFIEMLYVICVGKENQLDLTE